jgi:hypothetical protein
MGDMKGAARTTMAAKLIADVVASEHKPVKSDLLGMMVDAGVERVRVADDDGLNLGAVSLACGDPKAKVNDTAAFTAWVADRYPGELVQVVREAFAKKVLDGATAAGDPIDPATGEIIPGVEMVAGEPYVTVRPSTEARTRMRETLINSGLLSLPSGGEQA